jgi:hypothetical protein
MKIARTVYRGRRRSNALLLLLGEALRRYVLAMG